MAVAAVTEPREVMKRREMAWAWRRGWRNGRHVFCGLKRAQDDVMSRWNLRRMVGDRRACVTWECCLFRFLLFPLLSQG